MVKMGMHHLDVFAGGGEAGVERGGGDLSRRVGRGGRSGGGQGQAGTGNGQTQPKG
jgi:hypothetical protein